MDSAANNHIPPQDTEGIDAASLAVLFLVAFGFRLIYILQSFDNPLFGVALVDAEVYARWADRIAAGVWLWDAVGNYLPVYPAFLALQQIIFGSGPTVIKIIQSLMGAASAVLMAQAAARAWNRHVGLIAGYLIATNWMLTVFAAEMYAETFSIFFQSLFLYLLIRHTPSRAAVAGAGAAFALSAAARANLLVVLPVPVYWLLRKNRLEKKQALTAAALFCLGTALVFGPVLVRNVQLTGVPLLRAQGAWSLYAGLSPEFKGLHPPTGIAFEKHMNRPFQAGMRSVVEIERFWIQQTLQLLRDKPLAVAANFLRRLLIFFNQREWSQEIDSYAYRSYSSFLSFPWTGFWLIGPLGLLGFCCLRRPLSVGQWLLVGYTVAGFLSIVAFKASDRYRLPTAILLSVFAALALWQLVHHARMRKHPQLFRCALLMAFFGLLCWPDWTGLAQNKTARHDFYIGLHNETTGRLDEALASYRRSMQLFAWDADSPYRIGRILYRQQEPGRALLFAREALRRQPQFPDAFNLLARIHLQAERIDQADRLAMQSLTLNPVDNDSLLLLAEIRRRQGNVAEEKDLLTRAAPENGSLQQTMVIADRLTQMGDYLQAVQLFDRMAKFRDADRHDRVQAAMLAGYWRARYFQDAVGAHVYWRAVWRKFADFRFFAQQAGFLTGRINEPGFRHAMRKDPLWEATAAYAIGLKHLLNGRVDLAAAEFERCLSLAKPTEGGFTQIPQNWAWEDLQRLRQQSAPGSFYTPSSPGR